MPKKQNPWQKRQEKDIYVKQAKSMGYRSRAAFKLLEIQEKHQLFKPGMQVLELGAAPGSWSERVVNWIKPHGHLDAIDLLPMQAITHANTHQFDIESEVFSAWLTQTFTNHPLDWVLSDMAPNMCGHQKTDQLRSIGLCEETAHIASQYVSPGGGVLMKAFQGEGLIELTQSLKQQYQKLITFKPKASNRSAREVYLIAINKLHLGP